MGKMKSTTRRCLSAAQQQLLLYCPPRSLQQQLQQQPVKQTKPGQAKENTDKNGADGCAA
jgi:hypothetical protein